MVKTNSPLFSAEATGTLAKQLTFLNTRRGCTIRKRTQPRDRKTADQASRRAVFHFLTQTWASISSASKKTWSDLASSIGLTNFNTYVRFNMLGWHDFLAPVLKLPATRDQSLGTVTVGPTAAYAGHTIVHTIRLNPFDFNWGIIIFASTSTGFSTSERNATVLHRIQDSVLHTFEWQPPVEATWFFNARLFTFLGRLGPELGEFTPP